MSTKSDNPFGELARTKYYVTAEVTISIHTEVMASSEEEALTKARDRGMMSFCHQCARGEPDQEWVTCGELDGGPVNLRIGD